MLDVPVRAISKAATAEFGLEVAQRPASQELRELVIRHANIAECQPAPQSAEVPSSCCGIDHRRRGRRRLTHTSHLGGSGIASRRTGGRPAGLCCCTSTTRVRGDADSVGFEVDQAEQSGECLFALAYLAYRRVHSHACRTGDRHTLGRDSRVEVVNAVGKPGATGENLNVSLVELKRGVHVGDDASEQCAAGGVEALRCSRRRAHDLSVSKGGVGRVRCLGWRQAACQRL